MRRGASGGMQGRSGIKSDTPPLLCQRLSYRGGDLFKKMMSADGISGRKPYGLITRMMYCIGLKRRDLRAARRCGVIAGR